MTYPNQAAIDHWVLQSRKIRDTSVAFRECLKALHELIDAAKILNRRADDAERWQRYVADGLGYSEDTNGLWRCAMAAELVNGIRSEREAVAGPYAGNQVVLGLESRAQTAEAERDALKKRLTAVNHLFDGGPDTECRTVWRGGLEYVELSMESLREALGES